VLRVETSFQDTPDDGFYFVLHFRGRSLTEQLEELGLKDGDKVILWEDECDLELTAVLLFDYKHPMMFKRALWARETREDSSTNHLIQPHETELVGNWVLDGGVACGDAISERVDFLTHTYLIPIAYRRPAVGRKQETLYRDPRDGRLWERSFPENEKHRDGPPRLVVMTPQQAAEKYIAAV
jgi:hypothetical protein